MFGAVFDMLLEDNHFICVFKKFVNIIDSQALFFLELPHILFNPLKIVRDIKSINQIFFVCGDEFGKCVYSLK
jgi:hypothetical protein